MIKKLKGYEYKSDKELIDVVLTLLDSKTDKLDRASRISLLVSRPVVYLATIEEEHPAALLESLLSSHPHDKCALDSKVRALLDILDDIEYNEIMIKNIVKAVGEAHVDIAECIFFMDVDCEKVYQDELLQKLEEILPVDYYKSIKEEIHYLEIESESASDDDDEDDEESAVEEKKDLETDEVKIKKEDEVK